MNTELKPCPFCGSSNLAIDSDSCGEWDIGCCYCCASMGAPTREEVIEAWNTRIRGSLRAKSGVRGVWWDQERERWVAHVKVAGKSINLGRYVHKVTAIRARQQGEHRYWPDGKTKRGRI